MITDNFMLTTYCCRDLWGKMILVFFLHALQQYEQILTEIEVCLEMSCIDGLSWNLITTECFQKQEQKNNFLIHI